MSPELIIIAQPRVDGGAEWRQVVLAQLSLGDHRGGPVLPAHRNAVAKKVLAGGGDEDGTGRGTRDEGRGTCGSKQRVEHRPRIFLLPDHRLASHHRRQVDIFAIRLEEARPERLASEIHHRREVPRNAGGARLVCRDLVLAPHEGRIPGGGHREVLGEDRPADHVVEAVHRVDPIDHRDRDPLAGRNALHRRDELAPPRRRQRPVRDVEQRADVVPQEGVLQLRRVELLCRVAGAPPTRHRLDRQLRHLACLLLQRQEPQQRVDAGLDAWVEATGLAQRSGRRGERQHEYQQPTEVPITDDHCHPAGVSVAMETLSSRRSERSNGNVVIPQE
jgi:hypothetical protein